MGLTLGPRRAFELKMSSDDGTVDETLIDAANRSISIITIEGINSVILVTITNDYLIKYVHVCGLNAHVWRHK